jgi:hypothetical protein
MVDEKIQYVRRMTAPPVGRDISEGSEGGSPEKGKVCKGPWRRSVMKDLEGEVRPKSLMSA